ncbi:DUF3299 domain-containing protein [Bacteriovorax stolpii]|uniref:Uncharacterized protein n=1 Tax=Bacteriovorax stolpii TaxID=960 RepID=A0A2K9NT86_BACTC|nr:DUF3299 domain-containing protein [Bacteriovorax stolpii]AUN98697.1 hypothetical protein C0V70_11405 [Bacteriovorax stolpii]QDK41323.1 DUF3299 domain-containing protein [Bacteriovorax stolpii]TDP55794.1 hypothetical protein C8D79_0851 [Bacteriovorax stolpii]BDT28834.1 DUF3299 domain-containing protein [Bacteriovorax sp. HI3]
MKKTMLTGALTLLVSMSAFALDVPWETLKTLDFDTKTKKNVIKPELQKVLGKEVTIKGFMMPLDYEAKEIVEFLFMPYVPACMHVPPPPPNQLVLVKMKKGSKVKPSFYPIELTGKLAVETNADLESSFKMEGLKMKELKTYTPPSPQGAHP